MPHAVRRPDNLRDVEGFAKWITVEIQQAWLNRPENEQTGRAWADYCQQHLYVASLFKWPRDIRMRMVVDLTMILMSGRAVARVMGVDEQTVRLDLKRAGVAPRDLITTTAGVVYTPAARRPRQAAPA